MKPKNKAATITLGVLVLFIVQLACGTTPPPATQDINAASTMAAMTIFAQLTQEGDTFPPSEVATEAPTIDTPEPTFTTEPTLTTAPTDPPIIRDKIVMLPQNYSSKYHPELFTKLSGLAFENNIDLTIHDSRSDFLDALESPGVKAAIYENAVPNPDVLNPLYVFAKNGGHVLMLYQYGWHEHNDILQDLFGISVAVEYVIRVDSQNLRYPDGMNPSWLRGLSIGFTSPYDKSTIRSYLLTTKEGEKTYVSSQENGENRLMVIHYQLGDGEVIFWPQGYAVSSVTPNWNSESYYGHPRGFLNDASIDLYDNKNAALAMLQYLLER
jgi:hypothetical protein